jgi:hypothetical protein
MNEGYKDREHLLLFNLSEVKRRAAVLEHGRMMIIVALGCPASDAMFKAHLIADEGKTESEADDRIRQEKTKAGSDATATVWFDMTEKGGEGILNLFGDSNGYAKIKAQRKPNQVIVAIVGWEGTLYTLIPPR